MTTDSTDQQVTEMTDLLPPDLYELYGGAEAVEHTWTRLDTWHRIEGEVLRRLFAMWLPRAPAVIADVGGGNGRWAFELTAGGYDVALADLSRPLIDDARQRAVETGSHLAECSVADARNLPWPDDSFDGALLLGPLYHLFDRDDRLAALREAMRVVRPGGPVLVQVLHRVGALRQVVTFFGGSAGPIDWEHVWRTGTFDEPKAPPWYRSSYWHLPDEAIAEVREAGLELADVQGLDGPAPEGQAVLVDADQATVAHWADQAMVLGKIPAMWSTCNHLLIHATVPL